MNLLTLYEFGQKGVNVDTNNFIMDEAELRQSQNAIEDPLGASGGLRNRPGLIEFNSAVAAGAVLGGVGVPLINMLTGSRFLYIGRGPKS